MSNLQYGVLLGAIVVVGWAICIELGRIYDVLWKIYENLHKRGAND